jgi:8-hydroxy-5-deazaflavin:NADPH oxidoreductase
VIVAIVGGTGKEGTGLALRWARAGHHILIGSRSADRAWDRARELARMVPGGVFDGCTNLEASREGELAVVTVPHDGHRALLGELRAELAGKIVLETVVPLDFNGPRLYAPPAEGSAAEEAQAVLGSEVRVVAGLHALAAHELTSLDHALNADVLICGDDAAAKETVTRLIEDLGVRCLDAGPLTMAPQLEGLTAVMVRLNRRYRSKSAAIKLTGIDPGTKRP